MFENDKIDSKTLNEIWGPVVTINPFRRKDFIFVEGYYSAFKILIKITKDEIPIEQQYLNDVNEDKNTLINPIMFLCHHFIELALKRYIHKLGNKNCKGHNIKLLFEQLKKNWLNIDKKYSENFWNKKGWIQGYLLKNKFSDIDKIIFNLHSIDKNSVNFRYNSTEIYNKIDLNNLEKEIDYLYDFFEDLNISISCFE